MKRTIMTVIAVLTAATISFAGPVKFDEKFKAKQEKMLKKLVAAKVKPFVKFDIKKPGSL